MGGESPELDGVGLSDGGAFEDAKAFNKGKGKLLAGMLAIGLGAVGGFGWYLVQAQPLRRARQASERLTFAILRWLRHP